MHNTEKQYRSNKNPKVKGNIYLNKQMQESALLWNRFFLLKYIIGWFYFSRRMLVGAIFCEK
jgi:hypothetical protein